jgi:DNA polymerase III delta subunit
MVKKDSIYLVTGQDAPAKDKVLQEIKAKYLTADFEQFNLDTLFAKDVTLEGLQERLLYHAASTGCRVVVIKQASSLKKDCKEYLEQYVQAPDKGVIVVLEMAEFDRKDRFCTAIAACATVRQFRQDVYSSAFVLADEIRAGKAAGSLKLLHQLLKKGQKPEMILGALRAALSRSQADIAYMRKLNKLLLECDLAIKTSGLKPSFALERLVVSLCSFKHAFREA